MDLRSFELALVERRLRAVIADAAGERAQEFAGAELDAIAVAERAVVEAIAAAARRAPRSIAVDAVAQVARVSFAVDESDAVWSGARYDAIARVLSEMARAILNLARPRRPFDQGRDDADFWGELYRTGRDGWELGRAAPPIARWVATHAVAGRRALVVGCGRGHEARLLAHAGAEVVAVDLAPDALVAARALAAVDGARVDFRERDLFRLAEDPERYQLIVEHCCFCAIQPARRRDYAATVAALLSDGGELVGLFWAHGREGGPPFSVTRAELAEIFAPRFTVEEEEIPRDSVAARVGQEILIRFRRR